MMVINDFFYLLVGVFIVFVVFVWIMKFKKGVGLVMGY